MYSIQERITGHSSFPSAVAKHVSFKQHELKPSQTQMICPIMYFKPMLFHQIILPPISDL